MDVVAVDISGRHEVNGRYYMLCAAVAARISARHLEKVYQVRQYPRATDTLGLREVSDLVFSATVGLSGLLLAERGDFYNIERWRVQSLLGREFKYPESLGERLAVELAHHISLSGRRLCSEWWRDGSREEEGYGIEGGYEACVQDDILGGLR
ncbi:MAG: hypothetical protein A4E45_01886 [Methanosaeta sp. PtaB.Bin039]|nr:MAG: hypothetical protein A4E45_01886 [Methanosaeta sp. PtaB.Bin039]OPY45140.1 MAG: hypothetical protein A4E47_01128 [Methanosaeta sp. PtaU1.Bin028]